jgi:hypothetical protein
MSSSVENTLSNYFEVESSYDQVYSNQTSSIKQSKKTKSRTPAIEICIPSNSAKNVSAFIHIWDIVEETINPLSVSLGESLESRCDHLILDSSI